MNTAKRYPPEFRQRAVRLVETAQQDGKSEWAAILSVCEKLGCTHETLRRWLRQHQKDTGLRSDRAKQDENLKPEIQRVWHENFCVYGARKVWVQLNREKIAVARCTAARLMKGPEIQGVRRGKKMFTTVTDEMLARPRDAVNRDFTADRQTLCGWLT